MRQGLTRLLAHIDAMFGVGRFPPLAPAMAVMEPASSSSADRKSYGVKEMIDDMRILLGVPKYRTSKPKKVTRKFSYTRLLEPKTNLTTCQSCGSFHETDTICGICYEKVREVTNEIKKKMMQYNPYIGEKQEKEVHVKFSNDEPLEEGVVNGKRVVELERERPTWFKKLVNSK